MTVDEILEDLFGGQLYDETHGAFINVRSEKQIREAKDQLHKLILDELPQFDFSTAPVKLRKERDVRNQAIREVRQSLDKLFKLGGK